MLGRCENFAHMTPVHANKTNSAVDHRALDVVKPRLQEFNELVVADFARRHGEFAMFYGAAATGVPIDRYVVRRIHEAHIGFIAG